MTYNVFSGTVNLTQSISCGVFVILAPDTKLQTYLLKVIPDFCIRSGNISVSFKNER